MRLFIQKYNGKIAIVLLAVALVIGGIGIWHQINPDSHKLKPVATGDHIAVYQNGILNNFIAMGKIAGGGQKDSVNILDTKNQEAPHSGQYNIKATVSVSPDDWAGWMLMRGYFENSLNQYGLDWGKHPDCGYDLTGTETLTFMAKGATGSESVEFFMGGMGWQPEIGKKIAPYPDSTNKISSGLVKLSDEYQSYAIPLKGADLSYISCGFGFVVSGNYNKDNVTVYLDDIKITPIPTGGPAASLPLEIIAACIALIGALASALVPVIFRQNIGKTF